MLMLALVYLLGVLALSLCGSIALRKTPSLKLTFVNVVVFDIAAFLGIFASTTLWSVSGDGNMDDGWLVTVFMITTPIVGILCGLAAVKCLSMLRRAA